MLYCRPCLDPRWFLKKYISWYGLLGDWLLETGI
jgi:hypothetical protein